MPPKQSQHGAGNNRGAQAPQKQPKHGEQGTKNTNAEPEQVNNNMEWKQAGKNKQKEGHSQMSSKSKATNGTRWSGPDIVGDFQGEHGSDKDIFPNKAGRGEQTSQQPRGPISRSTSFKGGREKAKKGDYSDLQEIPTNAGAQRGARASFRHFDMEKAEARYAENHMSSWMVIPMPRMGKKTMKNGMRKCPHKWMIPASIISSWTPRQARERIIVK